MIVYFLAPAQLQGTADWQLVRTWWRDRSRETSRDDLEHELDAVNKTAVAIEKDASMLRPFSQDHGRDYCTVYDRLLRNCQPGPEASSTRNARILPAASRLAGQIPRAK